MGIHSLVMFLTDHYSIKEVLAFPFMKEVQGQGKEKKLAAEVTGVEPMVEEGIRKFGRLPKGFPRDSADLFGVAHK